MTPCSRAIPLLCTAVLVVTSGSGCGSRDGATQVGSPQPAAGRPAVVRQGPTDPRELEAFVDSVLGREMEAQHVPGVTFVFVKDGRNFLMKGYGFANLERQRRVDPESTLFRIGSISKVFTA